MLKKVFFMIILSSCAVKIKDFDKYQKAPMIQVENMPTKEQLAVSVPKIIISTKKPTNELAAKINAQDIIKNRLTFVLNEKKFASIVERKFNDDIQKEKKIAELEGKLNDSLKSVDYILEIDVTNIAFSSKLKTGVDPLKLSLAIAATANQNNQYSSVNNLSNATNQQYEYTATVDGVINVYQTTSMELLKTLPLKSTVKSSELASINSNLSSGIVNINIADKINAKEYDSNLISKSIEKAIASIIPDVKTFLKKRAYILEKRVFEKNTIYSINIGSLNGVESQDKLSITRQESEMNAITNEEEVINNNICNGIVAKNTIFESRAWVVFEKSCHEKIHLGDAANFIYKK